MDAHLILWPVFAQILLTLLVYLVLAARKAKAIRDKAVDRQQVALDNRLWPEDTVKVSNNIANQFEAPVLFYALCLAFLGLNAVSAVALFLASLFVLSRYFHAWVHTHSNHVPTRLRLFLVGYLILLVMLGVLGWELAIR